MDTSAQQGEIKQRLNELDQIISKLEDVGDNALADLVAARKAEKETLRGRLQEYKPTSERLKLAQDARDKAAPKHRQVGEELEALRLLLDAKAQAWREATLALELAQQEADTWAARLRREQEKVNAVSMPVHGMCNPLKNFERITTTEHAGEHLSITKTSEDHTTHVQLLCHGTPCL